VAVAGVKNQIGEAIIDRAGLADAVTDACEIRRQILRSTSG
jgi:hypothetical protein